jgi:phage terminase small subunit
MTKTKALTPQEKRFVDEYLIDLDVNRAALAAGYSKTMAATKAYQWVSKGKVKPHVFAAIQKRQQKRAEKLEINADRVLKELALIGFANMQDYMRANADGDPVLDFSQLTREQAAALSEVTVEAFRDGRGEDARDVSKVKFKLSDKRAALVDIGRHLGMFKENVSITGELTVKTLADFYSQTKDRRGK